MNCPKCQNSEVDSSGTCLICGYRAETDGAGSSRSSDGGAAVTGLIEIDYADRSSAPSGELPEWRRELARRLQEIKQRREGERPVAAAAAGLAGTLPFPEPATAAPSTQPPPRSAPAARSPRRAPRAARVRQPEPPSEPLPLFEIAESPARPAAPGAGDDARPPVGAEAAPREIESLIDTIIARQAAQEGVAPHRELRAVSEPETLDKWILLSRTLSGLIDMMIVFLCGSSFVLAAEFVSGIVVFDAGSWIHYGLTLLGAYLIYSVFFLETANQTIGMMITDLRIVDRESGRPRLAQVLKRSFVFVPSLLLFGAGLVWALFDRDADCWQDKYSGTRVVRLT